MRPTTLFFLPLFLFACNGGTTKTDTGTSGDADTDADSDADTDADTDADADADMTGHWSGSCVAPGTPTYYQQIIPSWDFEMDLTQTGNNVSGTGLFYINYDYGGSGYGTWTFPGSGYGTWTFPGSGYGTWTFPGSGFGTWTFPGSGFGTWTFPGSGFGTWTYGGSGFTYGGSGFTYGGSGFTYGGGSGTWTYGGSGWTYTPYNYITLSGTFDGSSVDLNVNSSVLYPQLSFNGTVTGDAWTGQMLDSAGILAPYDCSFAR
jgi:hypothetical protein